MSAAAALLKERVSPEMVIAAIRSAGREPFDGGAYDLNLVAVRHPDRRANTFNDWLHVLYRETAGGPWKVYSLDVTTDPGLYYRLNPSRVEGTAILKAGFIKSAWKLGLHKGEKRALVQAAPVTVWRDADRDAEIDIGAEGPQSQQTGTFGINIHRAGKASEVVDKWSAGCIVAQEEAAFLDLIALCDLQVLTHPSWQTFSLLLLEA